jgi:hypothetical protein
VQITDLATGRLVSAAAVGPLHTTAGWTGLTFYAGPGTARPGAFTVTLDATAERGQRSTRLTLIDEEGTAMVHLLPGDTIRVSTAPR